MAEEMTGQAVDEARGLSAREWEALCLILAQFGRGTVGRGPSDKDLKSAAGRLRTKGIVVGDGTEKTRRADGYGFHSHTIWRVTDLGRAVALARIVGLE